MPEKSVFKGASCLIDFFTGKTKCTQRQEYNYNKRISAGLRPGPALKWENKILEFMKAGTILMEGEKFRKKATLRQLLHLWA